MKKLVFLFVVVLIAIGMSVAQTGSSGSTSSGGNAASQSSGSTGQNPNPSTQSTPPPSTSGTASDQSTAGASDQSNSAAGSKQGNLPQTATPLPLLALLGLGSLATGIVNRFRK
jgi:hypothetical protein